MRSSRQECLLVPNVEVVDIRCLAALQAIIVGVYAVLPSTSRLTVLELRPTDDEHVALTLGFEGLLRGHQGMCTIVPYSDGLHRKYWSASRLEFQDPWARGQCIVSFDHDGEKLVVWEHKRVALEQDPGAAITTS
ncbi:MAG: hypothetical protein V1778_01925 [bacterium]